jgi:hypothetical protein
MWPQLCRGAALKGEKSGDEASNSSPCAVMFATAMPTAATRACSRARERYSPKSTVESRMGAVAWAMRQRSVSDPRSSNRTCGFPASGSPTGFTVGHTENITDRKRHLRGTIFFSHLMMQLSLMDSDHIRCLQAHRQSPSPRHLRKRARAFGDDNPLLCAASPKMNRRDQP